MQMYIPPVSSYSGENSDDLVEFLLRRDPTDTHESIFPLSPGHVRKNAWNRWVQSCAANAMPLPDPSPSPVRVHQGEILLHAVRGKPRDPHTQTIVGIDHGR